MALSGVSKLICAVRVLSQRSIHVAAAPSMSWKNKQFPSKNAFLVGYEKIRHDALAVGEDPFDSEDRDKCAVFKGSGTKEDPFLVPSRNEKRYVCVEMGRDSGPPPGFWVTKNEGGRCPQTGHHFKLQVIEGDKWGIDELDLFMH